MTDAHVTVAHIKRFELLLRTPLTETQRLTVEMLLGEALEKVGWLQPDPLPAGTTRIELRDVAAQPDVAQTNFVATGHDDVTAQLMAKEVQRVSERGSGTLLIQLRPE